MLQSNAHLQSQKDLQADIAQLIQLTAQDMKKVDEFSLNSLTSDVPMIGAISDHLFSASGKRLRPMLTLASAGCFDYQGQHHITLAAAIEFLHTATLLHDDVVDESNLRRGKKTARIIWGNQASVLVGDFLLGQAFKMMVEVGNLPALQVLSNASSVIAQGEVMQLAATQNLHTSEAEYLEIINSKTAVLFAAATEMGAIISGKEDYRKAMQQYGLNLGLAFQIIDDVLDYQGDSQNLGKNTGDDFREGKITLPLILSYKLGDSQDKAFWEKIFAEKLTDEDSLKKAIAIMEKTKALQLSAEKAVHYAELAKSSLKDLPCSPYKTALENTINFCLKRIQ